MSLSSIHRAVRQAHWIVPVLALVLCVLGLLHLAYHASYTLDDAYISFRYARNLARGLGLVYNPGEYVKGYSNTLFTLLMVVPELLGRNPIGLARVVGVLSFCGLCWCGYRLYREDPRGAAGDQALWLLAFFAISTPIAVHFITGLETGLHAALLFAATVSRLREQREGGAPWSALLFAAVVLSRPEGIVAFAAVALQDVAVRVTTRRIRSADIVWYLVPLLTYAGELGISRLYYGDALPQTYYAKARAVGGLGDAVDVLVGGVRKQFSARSYLHRGLESTGWGFAGLAVSLLALAAPARRLRNLAFVGVLLAQLVFILTAGYDWAPAFRFGVPALPFLFVLVVEAIGFVATRARARARLVGWGLALAAAALAIPVNLSDSRTIDRKRYVDGEELIREGEVLRKLAPPGVTLASYDIGGMGYRAGGFDILDTAGLTTREVSKCRGKGTPACRRAVARMRPAIVRPHPSGTKDTYSTLGAETAQPYLKLEPGGYRVQRSLVLVDRAPDGASDLSTAPSASGFSVIAYELASVLMTQQEGAATLYWRRDAPLPAALQARRLEWRKDGAHHDAQASQVFWSGSDSAAWPSDQLFADHVVFKAPRTEGRYELWVNAAGAHDSVRIASVDVVAPSAAPARAAALVAGAKAPLGRNAEDSALAQLRQAVLLDPTTAREAYQQTVIQRSRALSDQARALLESDGRKALRLLQKVQQELHRAYWESGYATPPLRHAIDDNARLRQRLIERAVRDRERKTS
jgi:arabinofuranosyltransferase